MPAEVILFRKGYMPDYHDARDKPFGLVRSKISDMAAETTDEYVIPNNGLGIFYQMNMNACVANAWVKALMLSLYLEWQANNPGDPPPEMLSRMFLYFTARASTGDQKRDAGTYLRSAAKQLLTVGICAESEWVYDQGKVFTSPTLECFNVASDNQIGAYYRVDDTGSQRLDDLEMAVRANHPPVFGTQVGPEMENYDGNPATVLTIPTQNLGGHALCITGVRKYADGKRDFLIDNSWSDRWGMAGRAWLSQDYIMWSQTQDLWVATRVPALVV